ncbi:MAG TPA: hypothetical protein DGG94_17395 [Micromonosporaceae bacterium]|nr:hypothetical protein [Micromonosporaceae bacterium]HCU51547.1 hypothetical protein [Micromonosporaceae bacterium]
MGSVVKKSISVPEHVWLEAEATAAEENTTVSALIAEAIENLMIVRRGLRAVRAWEREHGAFTAEELAQVEAELSAIEKEAEQ